MARLYLAGPLRAFADRTQWAEDALERGEALLLRGLWNASGAMTPDRASELGRQLLTWLGPRMRQHRKLKRNLGTAFPGWSDDRLETTARDSWGQFGRVLAEYPHLEAICRQGAGERIELVTHLDLEPVQRGERPCVFVSAHLGNWELAGAMGMRAGVPLSVIYSPQKNPAIDAELQRRRQALGCEFIDKTSKATVLVGALRRGRSLGIVIDQRFDESDSVPFFEHDAPAPIAPATLAARLGVPFVPVRVERLDPGCRFRITVEAPIEPDPAAGDAREIARDMTARAYARFEAWIRERPAQWLCTKRRWPDLSRRKWQEKLARNPRLVRSAADHEVAGTRG
ncbi:MAG: lysophospholipid acyltransferase family protein [Geminicoccaceae bacterium]